MTPPFHASGCIHNSPDATANYMGSIVWLQEVFCNYLEQHHQQHAGCKQSHQSSHANFRAKTDAYMRAMRERGTEHPYESPSLAQLLCGN